MKSCLDKKIVRILKEKNKKRKKIGTKNIYY